MRRVITYGTFDLLHYGHINLLRRAREQGDYLVVALSTDEFNWAEKHKKCYFSYEQRKQLLEAIRYVDLVIPEENWEQKARNIKEYHIDTFVMGDDWTGKFDYLKNEGCEVIYFSRTPEISSSQIKQDFSGGAYWSKTIIVIKEKNNAFIYLGHRTISRKSCGKMLVTFTGNAKMLVLISTGCFLYNNSVLQDMYKD